MQATTHGAPSDQRDDNEVVAGGTSGEPEVTELQHD